jgi:tripartite ATP-independent transporter DctM subunit
MLQTSAGALFAAATIPGLLLSGLYLTYIIAVAILQPHKAPRLPADFGPQSKAEFVRAMLKGMLPMTILMVVVLGSIFAGICTATESAAIGCAGSFFIAWLNGRFNMQLMRESITDSCRANAMVFTLFLGATCFSYVFIALGGGDQMIDTMAKLGLTDKWHVLIFLMVLIFLLGFPFEWIEICLIVLPVFAPVLAKFDFTDHLGNNSYLMAWFGTLVAVNLQTAFMTPPFGATLFYMKGTAPPCVTMNDVYAGMTPVVILQVIGLILCIAFPSIVLWLPRVAGLLD